MSINNTKCSFLLFLHIVLQQHCLRLYIISYYRMIIYIYIYLFILFHIIYLHIIIYYINICYYMPYYITLYSFCN